MPPSTEDKKTILVTGGAGFIGSHFVEKALSEGYKVVVLDVLNYAGNPENLRNAKLKYPSRYKFIRGSINGNTDDLVKLLREEHIDAIVNLAAQSSADASIADPRPFVEANIFGTCNLLQAALEYWRELSPEKRENFRFLQVSTDEVFGSLGKDDPPFSETTQIAPRNPYAAAKAAGDHMALAFFNTYKLPVIITNSGNNYGPRQHTEKFIPHMIDNVLNNKHYALYGDGHYMRDWLYVEDNCNGLLRALEKGRLGERYCLGGKCELTNLEVVHRIGNILQELCDQRKIPPRKDGKRYADFSNLIAFVEDRPGHDERYAVNISKAERELGFQPKYDFDTGLRRTVEYYIEREKSAARGR